MKNFLTFALRSFPLVIGLILTLVGLSFLIGFATDISVQKFEENDFTLFVVFMIIGIPTVLFGIERLASDTAP